MMLLAVCCYRQVIKHHSIASKKNSSGMWIHLTYRQFVAEGHEGAHAHDKEVQDQDELSECDCFASATEHCRSVAYLMDWLMT